MVTYLHSIKKQFHDRCLAGEVPEVIFESFPQQISIITGWGRNSESGVSIIKPLIENLLVAELVPPIRIIQQPFNNTGVILIPRSQLRRWLNMSVISNAKAVWRTHIPRSVCERAEPLLAYLTHARHYREHVKGLFSLDKASMALSAGDLGEMLGDE